MTDREEFEESAIPVLRNFIKEAWDITIILGRENFIKINQMLNDILKEYCDGTEIGEIRSHIINKIKELSNAEKGILILNPIAYEWISDEVCMRNPRLIKYFNLTLDLDDGAKYDS